jgi:hypothetical protein
MDTKHVIEVPLPEGMQPAAEELESLGTLLRAVVELHAGGHAWEAVARHLEEEGWTLHTRVGWIVEARRGRDFERATALTRDEAFSELQSLVLLDAEPSPP